MLTKNARYELLQEIRPRYLRARKREKQRILDEFVAATGYHRKYATHLLNHGRPVRPRPQRRRSKTYPSTLDPLLARISDAYRWPCSRNLHDFLEEALEILERNQEIDLSRREKTLLLQMSRATIDRRLKPFRKQRGDFRRRQTKPGSRLRREIPQRTSADWNDPPPGFLEIDLVSHGGGRSDGEFIHTLNVVDIATRWCDFEPIANRGERVTLAALEAIRARLPFPLQGIDSDNDSAFINNHLYRYCQREKLTFTRSRPYKKNDQAHIEQRNWTMVRQLIGYGRYDTPEALRLMRALYAVRRLFVNFFQPVRKLKWKERVDGKVRRRYDRAQTPYRRVLALLDLPQAKTALQELYLSLNPVELNQKTDTLLELLWKHAR